LNDFVINLWILQ